MHHAGVMPVHGASRNLTHRLPRPLSFIPLSSYPAAGDDMRKLVRFLVGTFLIVAALLAAFYYSSDTAIYECTGMLTKAKASNTSGPPVMLFAKITQNRF